MAAALCEICTHPIGFDTRFYGYNGPLKHARCAELAVGTERQSAPPFTKGQRVFIRPEWQDPGDDAFTWICTEDADGGRVSISPVDIGLPIPPVNRVSVAMLMDEQEAKRTQQPGADQ